MTILDSILKSRDIILLIKTHTVKAMVFPVVVYGCELDHKEGWALKNWCFWTVVLETSESPMDCKEISPEHSLERLMLKLKLQYFGHLMRRTDWLGKTLMLGKTSGRRRSGQQRIRWILASLTQWTWVWASSGSWWWTGKPGVLQSTGSQRVLVTLSLITSD